MKELIPVSQRKPTPHPSKKSPMYKKSPIRKSPVQKRSPTKVNHKKKCSILKTSPHRSSSKKSPRKKKVRFNLETIVYKI